MTPGLYVTVAVLAALLLTHAALLLGTIILGQLVTFGQMLVYGLILTMTVLLGTAVALVLMIRAMILTVCTPKTFVFGKPISVERHPVIWRYVRDLANKLGALHPENIVVGLDANFFVIEAQVQTLAGNLNGRTLYVSLPLSRILSEAEFRSIIGHELGHFRGEDTLFSRRFYPIYRGAGETISSLTDNTSGALMFLVLLPIVSVLSYFWESFAVAENEIGRQRELAADQIGVDVSSARDTASALVKVHAFGSCWENALQRMRDTLNEGKTVNNVSQVFCAIVTERSRPTAFVGLDDQRLSHPFDTHPPLNVRLDAIRVTMAESESAALSTPPENSAASLIDHHEELEIEITKAKQALMVRAGEVRLNAQIQCPACARLSPMTANACACGFRFGRYGG